MGDQINRCVVLSAGLFRDPEILRRLLRKEDWFVAADGGLRLAKALDVQPDLLVADFDSVEESSAASLAAGAEVVRLPVEKDCTDTLAAVQIALKRGYRNFLLLGCTGGRLDHTLANIAVLQYLLENGTNAQLADENNLLRLVKPGHYTIPSQNGYKLSLLPYAGNVEGVTLRGAAYPLRDATLTTAFPLGVSNEFVDEAVEISFTQGILMIFLSKD